LAFRREIKTENFKYKDLINIRIEKSTAKGMESIKYKRYKSHQRQNNKIGTTTLDSGNWGPFRPVGVILLLLGAAVFAFGCRLTWQKTQVMFWLTYQATVTAYDVKTSDPAVVEVKYAYEHEGKEYSSGGSISFSPQDSERIRRDFAAGQKIKLFVNTANPDEAIMMEQYLQQPRTPTETVGYILSILGGIVACIGLVIEAQHTIAQFKARSWHV